MPRKPSAAIPRSETTAELIARISAERDAPPAPDHRVRGRSRAGVLDAPEVAPPRRSTARATGLPRQGSPPDARQPRASGSTALPLQRSHDRRRADDHLAHDDRRHPDDEASTPAPRSRRALRSGGAGEVHAAPEPDDTPTVVIGYVEPIAPRQPGIGRRIVPIAIAATALVGIGIAIAQGFTFPGFADPEAVTPAVLVDATVPDPAPTGPTVPAPVNGSPPDAVPAAEPAADPQSDVTVTDAAVPQSDYSY